jgi:hypothetical protein
VLADEEETERKDELGKAQDYYCKFLSSDRSIDDG